MKPGWIAFTLLGALWPAAAQQYTINTVVGGVPPATPANALNTGVGTTRHVAMDGAGNIYFSSLNSVFQLTPGGVLNLIAGNSRPGYTGDGGPAVAASLNGPEGVLVDSSGNIYIADSNNNVIRMVTKAGVISTFAGTGAPGYSGDYGPANAAQFTSPTGMAFDGSGNLYVADTGNNVIRQITPGGATITTFAGNSYQGYAGDTGAPTSAALNIPSDVFVDSKGNFYIADSGNHVVREITVSDGNIYTIIGNATPGYSGDGYASNAAQLTAPRGVAVDSAGNIYVSDFGNSVIRKATPNTLTPTITQNANGTTTITFNTNSTITTIVGNGTPGFAGDGTTGGAPSETSGPWGLVVDSSGNVYFADAYNARVRKLASSGAMSTIAGNGSFSFSGDGGAAPKAQLYNPRSVVIDAQGNLYIADANNNRVRKVTPGGIITTFAGNGVAGFGGDGAAATSAQLNEPVALALDGSGNLYIADFNNERVRMVNSSGVISTVAGNGTAGFGGDGGAATSAEFNGPTALLVDHSGNVYVSDFSNSRVRKFTVGGNITTVAGNGVNGFGGDGGPAAAAMLNGPSGLAMDSQGNLYIADLDNARIRIVSPSGTINTYAGNGYAAVSGDGGPVSQATFAAPTNLLFDNLANLYVGDSAGRVRMISGGIISTIAGKVPAGYSGDGGSATFAEINGPSGLAFDASGNLYIADSNNNAIRQLQVAGTAPTLWSVANSASEAPGTVSPVALVALYGTGMGPLQLTPFPGGSSVPSIMAGTQVLFNGIPAPLLYVWTNQIGAVVPFGVTGQTAQISVMYGGIASNTISAALTTASPAFFTADLSGKGQAVAANANGTLNSAATPASTGSTITLLATGCGPYSPPLADGSVPTGTASLATPASVTIGGQTATVSYAGAAPGLIAGIVQINVAVPSNITAGSAVPIVLTVGGVSSPAGVTIAVSH